jgi:hypothetical protein
LRQKKLEYCNTKKYFCGSKVFHSIIFCSGNKLLAIPIFKYFSPFYFLARIKPCLMLPHDLSDEERLKSIIYLKFCLLLILLLFSSALL